MNFNFFESFYQYAKTLTPKVRHAFYDAILGYFFEGIEPDAKNPAYGAFMLVKVNIDNSKKCKALGAKGGSACGKSKARLANKNTSEYPPLLASKNASQTQAPLASKNASELPPPLANKNASEKEKEKEKEKDNTSPLPPCEGGRGAGEASVARTKAEELFEAWWAAYPRHDGKKPARDKFVRLMLNEGKNPVGMAGLADRLTDAVAAAKQSDQWTKDGGQFIPMPSTWLNQRRWEDEGLSAAGAQAADGAQRQIVDDAAEKMFAVLHG